MRPLAGVSHDNRIVWNYYAECIMGDKQINTNQNKANLIVANVCLKAADMEELMFRWSLVR